MESRSIYGYYWFGTCLRYLIDAQKDRKIHGDGFTLFNIKRFLDYLKDLRLFVTERAAENLRSFSGKLSKLDKDARLSSEQAEELQEMMNVIRTTLEAEINGIKAFSVTQKRIDIDKLINDVPSLFAPGIFSKMPDIAKYDFNEAGKCIAFERSTAAAFHILRGTEDCIRHYYLMLVRQRRVQDYSWGPVVKDLRSRRKTQKYETLHNHLDNIRLSFRNPTQHPEKIYDIQEVQDLWNLCIEAANRMCKILKEEGI